MVFVLPSQNVVDDIESDNGGVLSQNTIRCTILERDDWNDEGNDTSALSFPHGMVIDDACSKVWLAESVQATRKNLQLNHKRPTVDRRFYCDSTRKVISDPLESIVRHALELASNYSVKSANDKENAFVVYCNKYLRFLEYKTVGGELLPHRDGIKTCEDTCIKSTHTLLLFLSDCEIGGETLIMDDTLDVTWDNINWSKEKNLVLDVYENHDENLNENNYQSDSNIRKNFNKRRIRYITDENRLDPIDAAGTKIFRLEDASIRSIDNIGDYEEGKEKVVRMPPPCHVNAGIQPSEGRILLFPHHWPHAGAMCQSVPKIVLRAELTIARA